MAGLNGSVLRVANTGPVENPVCPQYLREMLN